MAAYVDAIIIAVDSRCGCYIAACFEAPDQIAAMLIQAVQIRIGTGYYEFVIDKGGRAGDVMFRFKRLFDQLICHSINLLFA